MSETNWELNENQYLILCTLVERHSGLHLQLNDRHIFERKIRDSIQERGYTSFKEYLNVLRYDQKGEHEINRLIDLITNNETYFFREPSHFELLKTHILPELLQKGISPIKIWSAGCATGEEAYTLAIVIKQFQQLHGSFPIRIIATDIDMTALRKAGEARYGQHSFRGVNPSIIRSYFTRNSHGWVLNRDIVNMVDFRHLNQVNGVYPSGDLHDVDVIFFRNVSIYFKPETNLRILSKLYDTLREGGYLFPGVTETMQYRTNPFFLREVGNVFILQKVPQPAPASKPVPPPIRPRPIESPVPSEKVQPTTVTAKVEMKSDSAHNKALNLQQAIEFLNQSNFMEASAVLNELIEERMAEEDAMLLMAHIQFNRGNVDQARQLIERVLLVNDIRPEAFLLQGMIKKNMGETEEAIRVLQKALFLQGNMWVANYQLAEIYRASGAKEKARREYTNAIKNLQKATDADWALYLGGFSQDYMIRVCQKNLQTL